MEPSTMFAAIELLIVSLAAARSGADLTVYHDRIDGLLLPSDWPGDAP